MTTTKWGTQPQEMLAERDPDNRLEASIAEIRAVSSGAPESVRLQDLRNMQRRTSFISSCYTTFARGSQITGASYPTSASHFGEFGVSCLWMTA